MIKTVKPAKKKILPTKESALKKAISATEKNLAWLKKPRKKSDEGRLEKILKKHYPDSLKHSSRGFQGDLHSPYAHLGEFIRKETPPTISACAYKSCSMDELQLKSLRIELAKALMPRLLELSRWRLDAIEILPTIIRRHKTTRR